MNKDEDNFLYVYISGKQWNSGTPGFLLSNLVQLAVPYRAEHKRNSRNGAIWPVRKLELKKAIKTRR